eukprot:1157779-Pelagomonas_calceolata.AAC.28
MQRTCESEAAKWENCHLSRTLASRATCCLHVAYHMLACDGSRGHCPLLPFQRALWHQTAHPANLHPIMSCLCVLRVCCLQRGNTDVGSQGQLPAALCIHILYTVLFGFCCLQGGNANVGGQGQLQGAMAGSSSGSRGGGKGGGVAFATTPPPSNLGLRTSMPLGSGPMSEVGGWVRQ